MYSIVQWFCKNCGEINSDLLTAKKKTCGACGKTKVETKSIGKIISAKELFAK